jgi:hypothetical protein
MRADPATAYPCLGDPGEPPDIELIGDLANMLKVDGFQPNFHHVRKFGKRGVTGSARAFLRYPPRSRNTCSAAASTASRVYSIGT